MKRPNKKTFSFSKAFLFCILLVMGVFLVTTRQATPKTEMAYYGTAERKVSVEKGYLIRAESVLEAPAEGTLSCFVAEGDRVQKGSRVAGIYTEAVDEAVQAKLIKMNERLSHMEKSLEKSLFAGDALMLETAIAGRVKEMIVASYQQDVAKVPYYLDDISNMLSANTKDGSVGTYEQLKQEKEQLERSISASKVELYAPVSGVFSTDVDGYESVLNSKSIETLTPSYLNNIKPAPLPAKTIQKGQPCAKVLDNYEWYYAAVVDGAFALDLKQGSRVELRFPDRSEQAVPATVHTISREENGKVVLVVACNQFVEDIYRSRISSADIIKQSYKGLKLPQSAIQTEADGSSGVYVVKEGVVRYRKVVVEYVEDDFVIVREDNNANQSILLYDEVVVNTKNIKEGMILK